MAYRDLESITEKLTFWDYTDLFEKLQEKGMKFSQLKEVLTLKDDSLQQIQNKKPLSFKDEQNIKKYLDLKSNFAKTEYFFDYPPTIEGSADRWKAIELFIKLKEHNFSILVDKRTDGENKYKLVGNVNGEYYEQEVIFSYDTSAIIVLASYVQDSLN